MRNKYHLIAIISFTLAAFPACGAVIYSDAFGTGSGTNGSLNGIAPDVRPGAQTWSSSDWREFGTVPSVNFTADNNAFLPFVPLSGNIYTLSLTMTAPANGSSTTGQNFLGFTETKLTTSHFVTGNNAGPYFQRGRNPANEVFSGLGPGATLVLSEAVHTGTQTFSIVLNTQAAAWTAEWFIGGVSVRGATAYSTNPTINYVGFGRLDGTQSTVTNFTLDVVPEPRAALLGSLGMLMLLRRHRA